jgi:SpoVK/Ycf46/Vps4 family AAA+-type ATPase
LFSENPGALTVVPGERPVVDLTNVVGSGFDEVRAFAAELEASHRFQDLFRATSPSRQGDKANVLLIGPPGCGKSELLRGIGAQSNSIAIYAAGSDFLTCWKGEAEKNPGRLFKSAVKLMKESNRRVHILIDEIDAILGEETNPSGMMGGFNLVTEFLQLLDGIVEYPLISLWGATNHPHKMSARVMRRFQKVALVGELSQDNIVHLLKHFLSHLPTNITYGEYVTLAQELRGCVGDVIRKISDSIWREKMTGFVSRYPEKAESLIKDILNVDGEKFDIMSLSPQRKENLVMRLSEHFSISAKDVELAIREHLSSPAIQFEIEEARRVYASGREMISKSRNVSLL